MLKSISNNTIEIECSKFKGMGTNIGTLCRLLASEKKIRIITTNCWYDFFSIFKEKFNIENLELIMNNYTEDITYYDHMQDNDKFFCDYIKTGNRFQKKRPYIGLACTNGVGGDITPTICEFRVKDKIIYPRSKEYSAEHYGILFTKFKQWGYDIISLDNQDFGLKDKINFIENECHAVIGYEGGITHLAHMLNVPCLILPWHRDPAGRHLTDNIKYSGFPSPFSDMFTNYTQSIHLDSKTHFLNSFDQLMNFSQDEFDQIIEWLNNDISNNIFLQPDVDFIFNSDLTRWSYVNRKFSDTRYPTMNTSILFSENSRIFFLEHAKYIKIGGIKNFCIDDSI